MSLHDLLPTKKVTAFALGAAMVIVGFWFAQQAQLVDGWPEAWVLAAFATVVGFIVAWVVPESAWRKVQGHMTAELTVETQADGTVEVEGPVTIDPTEGG